MQGAHAVQPGTSGFKDVEADCMWKTAARLLDNKFTSLSSPFFFQLLHSQTFTNFRSSTSTHTRYPSTSSTPYQH
jgi:hypothetical protein